MHVKIEHRCADSMLIYIFITISFIPIASCAIRRWRLGVPVVYVCTVRESVDVPPGPRRLMRRELLTSNGSDRLLTSLVQTEGRAVSPSDRDERAPHDCDGVC